MTPPRGVRKRNVALQPRGSRRAAGLTSVCASLARSLARHSTLDSLSVSAPLVRRSHPSTDTNMQIELGAVLRIVGLGATSPGRCFVFSFLFWSYSQTGFKWEEKKQILIFFFVVVAKAWRKVVALIQIFICNFISPFDSFDSTLTMTKCDSSTDFVFFCECLESVCWWKRPQNLPMATKHQTKLLFFL